MCPRRANIEHKWRHLGVLQGDLIKMSLFIWCMLLFFCASSKEMVLDQSSAARWRLYDVEKGHNFIRNLKRHSDGTFTSDFTNNRDKMKAKDFVKWLTNTKRERCHEDLLELLGV